eukprot:s4224_g5.t1
MASAASSASRFNRSWERIHRTWLRVQPELGRHPTVQQFYELLFDGYVESWQHLEAAAAELTELAKFNLGDWRMYQLYGRLLDVYTVLSRDTKHVALAAQWAVQRAVHPLGQNAYATEESSEKDDFNQAITAAMLYYRRIGDQERLQNAMEFANKHPYAATHYQNSWQTPRTFHPGYRGQPWWEGDSFQLVQRLEGGWRDPDTRTKITEELNALLSKGAFERIFSPSALVVPGSVNEDRNGAEWSEYLLYDPKSVKLDEAKCAGIPTLSSLLRDPSNKEAVHPEINKSTVVSILSLDPGARIMPHCGVTNRQLVMHFALKGSDGVEFTVAGETRGYGGDGHAIVFDDSFEHSVYHAGKERRYILFAMLRHPDTPLLACHVATRCKQLDEQQKNLLEENRANLAEINRLRQTVRQLHAKLEVADSRSVQSMQKQAELLDKLRRRGKFPRLALDLAVTCPVTQPLIVQAAAETLSAAGKYADRKRGSGDIAMRCAAANLGYEPKVFESFGGIERGGHLHRISKVTPRLPLEFAGFTALRR